MHSQVTGELNRARTHVTPEEAAHLVAFFDRDGDGHLTYSEFMRLLQDSKHLHMAGATAANTVVKRRSMLNTSVID